MDRNAKDITCTEYLRIIYVRSIPSPSSTLRRSMPFNVNSRMRTLPLKFLEAYSHRTGRTEKLPSAEVWVLTISLCHQGVVI